MTEPLLTISDLTVEYRSSGTAVPAISNFSMEINAGESVGLVGESGCGKSTLAMSLMRYLGRNGVITAGRILFRGRDLVCAPESELQQIRGAGIAMVYQEPASALNPTMTIGDQLREVPMTHHRVTEDEARERAVRVLADVHMPDPEIVMRRFPHQLSGGQKQRIVIAMALLANPALLLLDEPTTGLDVTVEAVVLDLIRELRDKYGTAQIFISHNLGVIAAVCDRVGVMYAGELIEEAPARELFANPRHPYTRGLLDCVPRLSHDKRSTTLLPIPGQVGAAQLSPQRCIFGPRCTSFRVGICDAGPVGLREIAPGHRVRCERWAELAALPAPTADAAAARISEDLILDVTQLSKVYELGSAFFRTARTRLVANEDLNFGAARGSILAMVGESGSGKSTFARVLAGLQCATAGRASVKGMDLAMVPVNRRTPALVADIQMVFQNPEGTLNPSHTVGWPIARALKCLGIARARAAIDDRVNALLEMVRLPPAIKHRKPRQLSGGQKQRIAIARAFAGNPAILVADEPVSALDVSVQAAIVNLLLRIQTERHTTLLFISHDLALVRHLADQVVVMYLGKVMEKGPTDAIFAPPYHPYTEALLSAIPIPDPTVQRKRVRLEGDAPSPINLPKGCRFAGRCPRKLGAICDLEPPPEQQAGPDHMIACHIPVDDLRKLAPIFSGEPRPARAH
jgi:peptide/nickel transport system ATP-binding protein